MLHVASSRGETETVYLQLDRGDAKNTEGRTPSQVASGKRNNKIIPMLSRWRVIGYSTHTSRGGTRAEVVHEPRWYTSRGGTVAAIESHPQLEFELCHGSASRAALG
jgi:hypothetical protein